MLTALATVVAALVTVVAPTAGSATPTPRPAFATRFQASTDSTTPTEEPIRRDGVVVIDRALLPTFTVSLADAALPGGDPISDVVPANAPITIKRLIADAEPTSLSPHLVESFFVESINDLRAERGLDPLERHAELTSQARYWADVLAGAGALRHAADLSVGVSERWALLGENVGYTSDSLQVLFDAFVASPTHLENLVEPGFDTIGIGVTISGGRLWTVHRFMDIVGSARRAPHRGPRLLL